MATLGNIVWFILIGWWNFLIYAVTGIACFITIIGIPVGKAMFQYAKLMAFPFGKEIVKETFIKGEENVSGVRKFFGVIANILWLPFGIVFFLISIPEMILGVITIVGIPGAVVLARSSKFLLWPIGAKVITKKEADAIRMSHTVNEAVSNQLKNYEPLRTTAENSNEKQAVALTSSPAKQAVASEKTGPSAFDNFKETCGAAASSVAATTKATGSKIKARKEEYTQEVLSRNGKFSFNDMMAMLEVSLFKNPITSWIMPFLEVIVGVVLGVSFVLSLILTVGGRWYLVYQVNIWFSPFVLALIILTVIKRSNICFLVEMVYEIIISIFMHNWFHVVVFVIVAVCYAVFVMKGITLPNFDSVKIEKFKAKPYTGSNMVEKAVTTAEPDENVNRFCANCGAAIVEGAKFCAKCGTKQN